MGDISRNTFDPQKHYSGVKQQQGRVQVDADWNEQLEIHHHRTETECRDVIGLCGVPKKSGGFEITPTQDGQDLTISPGRLYVDGLLCELEATTVPITFTQDNQTVQANQAVVPTLTLDRRKLQAGEWVEISAAGHESKLLQITGVGGNVLTLSGDITDYRTADAIFRRITTYITQADYPNADFTSSLASPPSSPPGSPPSGFDQLSLSDGTYLIYLDAWRREISALDDPHIREVALGGPDTATRLKTVWQVKVLRVSRGDAGQATCETQFKEWENLTARSTGEMNARTKAPEDTNDPCLLPPGAGYRRLENQLYRVEIHTGGPRDAATFTFSRDNATVATKVEEVAGNKVTVSDVGKDEVLGFASGQWVDIVDDESELKAAPRQLVQIESVENATRVITMKTSLSTLENRPRLKLLRWDQQGATATTDGVKMMADWIDLEGGVQVQFSEGKYRSGDYWLIPARTATGELEWPPFEIPNTQPIPQPPVGISHHYCRLALVEVSSGTLTLQDCRRLFPPLTDLGRTPDRAPGIHIVGVDLPPGEPLDNDSEVRVKELAKGIRVRCDEIIQDDSVRGKPTCFVTLDLPFPFSGIDRQVWGDDVVGFQPLTLAAEVGVGGEDREIFWVPTDKTQAWLEKHLFAPINDPANDPRRDRVLAHLTLKGNFIWAKNNPSLYLDGEVFGARQEGANVDIRLPSGDEWRGGDFEMWFWLVAPRSASATFKVNRVRILSTGPDPVDPNSEVLGELSATSPDRVSVPSNRRPNAVEVQFTAAPDRDSLINGKTFSVVKSDDRTGLKGKLRFMPDNNTVRWVVASSAGLTRGLYIVTLEGNDSLAVTSRRVPLDGEPTQLPSGDNVPGGAFKFELFVE